MSSNIVTAAFGASRSARTRALHQWDYGQILQFVGLNLPDAYTVHFSNVGVGGTAKTMLSNADGVDIPDEYLTTGQPVYAWVYLHTGDADGETVYSVVIPVTARPKPTEEEPTPVQQGLIDQAIAALNAGVEDVHETVENVQDTIDMALQRAKESGEFDGEDGVSPTVDVTEITGGHRVSITDAEGTETFDVPNGDPGAPGISPTVTVTDITGGHRVTITDATGPHSFDVMDGQGAVQDVQVDGVSVLSDGVANVPLASPTAPGVVVSGTITVTGSTPTITALPGIRYVCGEVTTIDITLPASGIVDVVFESGSTATVLTITPPTGVTMKWANGFDPNALEADTTYEINITDGLGVAASWT